MLCALELHVLDQVSEAALARAFLKAACPYYEAHFDPVFRLGVLQDVEADAVVQRSRSRCRVEGRQSGAVFREQEAGDVEKRAAREEEARMDFMCIPLFPAGRRSAPEMSAACACPSSPETLSETSSNSPLRGIVGIYASSFVFSISLMSRKTMPLSTALHMS